MARTLQELTQKRGELGTQIQTRAKEFQANGQKFKDAADKATWDQVNKDYDGVMAELTELNESSSVTSRLALIEEHNREPNNPQRIGLDDAGNGRVGKRQSPGDEGAALEINEARELAVSGWLRAQMGGRLSKPQAKAIRQLKFPINSRQLSIGLPQTRALNQLRSAWLEHRDSNRSHTTFEHNASLTSTIPSTGRNIIPSETLLNELEVNMLTYGAVRQAAEQIVTGHGEPMGWPTVDDTSNEGRELSENAAADNNAGTGTSGDGGPNPTFGKTIWNAYKYTSDAILVPYELIEDNSVNLVPIIFPMLGERLGRITNRRFTVGTGAAQPEGIVTGCSLGVTAASASAITPGEVIDLEHSVDASQRDGAGYMLNDLTLAHLRKLADTTGRFIWQAGFNTGAPDTLNNRPYFVNNHMAVIAASAFVLLFGNFKKYKIRRVNQVRLYRLEERYREKDKDGFVAFVREDGGLLNAGTMPVKKLQMHS